MKKLSLMITILGLFLFTLGSTANAAPIGTTVGKAMPTFTLNGLDGNGITVAPSDKVTILNFWATWCPPCRSEMPELNEFFLQYGDQFAFYSINLKEGSSSVNDFMYKNGYSMPVLLDSSGEVGALFQVKFIPTTIVVDTNGIIKYRKSGSVTKSELENVINNW